MCFTQGLDRLRTCWLFQRPNNDLNDIYCPVTSDVYKCIIWFALHYRSFYVRHACTHIAFQCVQMLFCGNDCWLTSKNSKVLLPWEGRLSEEKKTITKRVFSLRKTCNFGVKSLPKTTRINDLTRTVLYLVTRYFHRIITTRISEWHVITSKFCWKIVESGVLLFFWPKHILRNIYNDKYSSGLH